MRVEGLTPILNVASLQESFAWFAQLGWEKLWDWGDPPDFGAVRNGKVEIFLCLNGQGGRGGAGAPPDPWDNTGGAWMSWWVGSPAEVDAVHALALERGVTVSWPPTDMPWGVRECHLLHPDGHTFRVSAGIETH
jgi:catechol 2,3-dioxygenase-like lactoylglutathione lyase family enzyme